MRIAIDARFWSTQAKGLGRYTEELVSRLHTVDPETTYVILLRKEAFSSFKSPGKNIQKKLADFQWYSFQEQQKLPSLLKSLQCDLIHFPHFNVPYFTPRPFCVTIHDLILSKYPSKKSTTLGPLAYSVKQAAYRLTIRRALKRAAHVVTISHFTEQDIMRTYDLPQDHISVIYEGITPFPRQPESRDVLNTYGIVRPYLLYVGNAYPHKNLERLISAFAKLRAKHFQFNLVLVGQMDYFYSRLKKDVQQKNIPGIVFTGYVPDSDLGELYKRAAWYIFPSLYEGFGLPPLEAMQQGTPVMASSSSCLPEILGDAPIYFSPHDERDMMHTIQAYASDEEARIRCKERSQAVLQRYSWDTMCAKTVALYHSIASQKTHAHTT